VVFFSIFSIFPRRPFFWSSHGLPFRATKEALRGNVALGAPRHGAWAGCFIFARYSLRSRNQ